MGTSLQSLAISASLSSSTSTLYSYSKNQLHLAISHTLTESSRILIYQLTSNQVIFEYVPPPRTFVTSLTWKDSTILILGLSNGIVQLLQVMEGQVISTLENIHTAKIQHTLIHPNLTTLFTCSDDGWIVSWDLQTMTMKKKFKTSIGESPTSMVLSQDASYLAVADTSVTLFTDLLSDPKELYTFSSHASPVHFMLFGLKNLLCTSTFEDRFIQRHLCNATSATILPSFSLSSSVKHLCMHEHQSYVASVAKDGKLYLWSTSLDSLNSSVPQSKKMKFASKEADVIIDLKDQINHSSYPITSCTFTSNNKLIITWGNGLDPTIEYLDYLSEKGTLLPSRTLYRSSKLTAYTLTPEPTPQKPASAQHVIPTQFMPSTNSNSMSFKNFAEQLKEISSLYTVETKEDSSSVPKRGVASIPTPSTTPVPQANTSCMDSETEPSTSTILKPPMVKGITTSSGKFKPLLKTMQPYSVHITLTQALQTRDDSLLESTLMRSYPPKSIQMTLLRMNTKWVIPLLYYLLDRLSERATFNKSLLPWVHATLIHHAGYLLTLPDVSNLLAPLYHYLQTRVYHAQGFQSLMGRIHFILEKRSFAGSNASSSFSSSSSSNSNSFAIDPSSLSSSTSPYLTHSSSTPPTILSYASNENATYEDMSFPTAGTTLRHVFPKASKKTWKKLANDLSVEKSSSSSSTSASSSTSSSSTPSTLSTPSSSSSSSEDEELEHDDEENEESEERGMKKRNHVHFNAEDIDTTMLMQNEDLSDLDDTEFQEDEEMGIRMDEEDSYSSDDDDEEGDDDSDDEDDEVSEFDEQNEDADDVEVSDNEADLSDLTDLEDDD